MWVGPPSVHNINIVLPYTPACTNTVHTVACALFRSTTPSPASPPSSPAALLCSGDPLLEQQLHPLHRATAVVCRGPPSACFRPPLLSVQRLNRRVRDHSSVVYSLGCCATADENRRRQNLCCPSSRTMAVALVQFMQSHWYSSCSPARQLQLYIFIYIDAHTYGPVIGGRL
jgi:hypothetical protein